MRIVAALGGNALLRRGQDLDVALQRSNVKRAAAALAPLAREHELVVTHGNGPQVGWLALQAAPDPHPQPLDVLGAESEGMIGYLLEQELAPLVERPVATLLTQTVVDRHDPAFERPTKPIGPVYSRTDAERLAAQRGWTMAIDGDGLRRVVASPDPRGIVEVAAIRLLLDHGTLVICTGGGGIPVARNGAGVLAGVEAVVDKDLASALLAVELDADVLLLLTDVAGIERGRGTPEAELIRAATPDQLRLLGLPAGSMGPKAEACARFVERTGGRAVIGSLEDAPALLAGRVGTQVGQLAPSTARASLALHAR